MAPPSNAQGGQCWLIDGYNVLQVAGLAREAEHWWGRHARQRLLTEAARVGTREAEEVVVVFDGAHRPDPDPSTPAVRVVFAPSADDWILGALRAMRRTGGAAVVTADRRLAARARAKGARVVSPRSFLQRCRGVVDAGIPAVGETSPE